MIMTMTYNFYEKTTETMKPQQIPETMFSEVEKIIQE